MTIRSTFGFRLMYGNNRSNCSLGFEKPLRIWRVCCYTKDMSKHKESQRQSEEKHTFKSKHIHSPSTKIVRVLQGYLISLSSGIHSHRTIAYSQTFTIESNVRFAFIKWLHMFRKQIFLFSTTNISIHIEQTLTQTHTLNKKKTERNGKIPHHGAFWSDFVMWLKNRSTFTSIESVML